MYAYRVCVYNVNIIYENETQTATAAAAAAAIEWTTAFFPCVLERVQADGRAVFNVIVVVVVRVPSTERFGRLDGGGVSVSGGGQRARFVDDGRRHRVGRGRARVTAVGRAVGRRPAAQAPDAPDGHPHLRLAPDHDEYEHALQRVHQVGQVPHVVRAADHPRQNVHHPRDAHHDHQLQAHAAQGGPANNERTYVVFSGTCLNVVSRRPKTRITSNVIPSENGVQNILTK